MLLRNYIYCAPVAQNDISVLLAIPVVTSGNEGCDKSEVFWHYEFKPPCVIYENKGEGSGACGPHTTSENTHLFARSNKLEANLQDTACCFRIIHDFF